MLLLNNAMRNIFCVFLMLSIAFCAYAKDNVYNDSVINYGDNPMSGRYYKIRGFKMYVEEYGKGKPLLMIHGNGGSIKAFKKNIPYFAKAYRVIVADSRAQGKSVDSGDSLTFDMMADDEAALLEKMNIDSTYVIGFSDGGIVSLVLAIRHPEKVIKLAATGADICPDSTAKAMMPFFWDGEKKAYNEFVSKSVLTPEEKNSFKLLKLDWCNPDIKLAQMQSIKCPALIIGGDHDIIKVEHTVQIYKEIPNAYLWILPDSGHGTLIEHSGEFNCKVDAFFKTPYKNR